MEVLKDYPQEFSKMFQPSFNLLFKVNLKFWFNNEGWVTRYSRFLYVGPTIGAFSLILFIDLCKMMKKGDIFEISHRLPPILVVIQALLKIILLFPKSTQITNIIKELGALWRTTGLNDKQLKDRHTLLKRANFCCTGTYWITIIGSYLYLLSPFFETLYYKLILQEETELMLPLLASSYPFNPEHNWVAYIAAYLFQINSMFLCVFAHFGTELIIITMCALLCIEFTMLCEDLSAVIPVSKKMYNIAESTYEAYKIEDFVIKHQKLISLSTQMDNVFNRIIFVDILFVGGTTCFFRYSAQFSRGLNQTIINYMAVVALLLFVLYLCYYGELLTSASLRIGEVAYENLWYKGDKHYQKIILIIIKRSQNACCMTSMKYAPITLKTFTKVISTTWSYISLMNSLVNE